MSGSGEQMRCLAAGSPGCGRERRAAHLRHALVANDDVEVQPRAISKPFVGEVARRSSTSASAANTRSIRFSASGSSSTASRR